MNRTAVLALILLFVAVSLNAAETKPNIDSSTIGFRSLIRTGRWSPGIVTVSNPGPKFHGTIDLESHGSKEVSSRIFSMPVFVPAQCRRTFWYPVKFESTQVPYPGKKNPMVPYEVRLGVSGIVADADNFYCGITDPYPHYITGIDKDGGRHLVNGEYLKHMSREIICTGWTTRYAPERMQEYLCVDTLVVGNTGDEELSTFQQRAITDWVQAGGLLVFSPGIDPSRYDGTILGDILPVRLTGLRMVNSLSCLDRFGEPFRFENPVPVLESVLVDGNVLISEHDLPIVVSKSVGMGQVLFVAPDITDELFRSWGGVKNFFVFLADRPSKMFSHEEEMLAEKSQAILDGFAGLKVPKRRSIVIYLAIVLAVVLIPPYALRKSGLEGVGWGVALSACVAFTIGAYVAGKRMKGIDAVSVNEVYFAKTVSGWTKAKYAGFAGVITPRRIYSDVVPNSRDVVFDPVGKSQGKGVLTVFENSSEDGTGMNRFLVNENSMRAFSFSGLADLGGNIDGKCTLTEEGLVLTLKNNLSYPLEDGFLRFNRLVVNIADIEPGGEARAGYGLSSSPAGLPSYTRHTLSGREGIIRNELRKCFFPDPVVVGTAGADPAFAMRRHPSRYSGAAFFGWSRSNSDCFQITDGQETRAVGLVGVRLPVVREGSHILVPRGICEMKSGESMATTNRGGELLSGMFPATLEIEFILPEACRGMRSERLRAFWDFQAKTVKAKIEVGRKAGDEVEYVEAGQGDVIDVPQPERFIDGVNSSVFLRVSMEGPKTTASTDFVLADTSWQLWGLDVEIEGEFDD